MIQSKALYPRNLSCHLSAMDGQGKHSTAASISFFFGSFKIQPTIKVNAKTAMQGQIYQGKTMIKSNQGAKPISCTKPSTIFNIVVALLSLIHLLHLVLEMHTLTYTHANPYSNEHLAYREIFFQITVSASPSTGLRLTKSPASVLLATSLSLKIQAPTLVPS